MVRRPTPEELEGLLRVLEELRRVASRGAAFVVEGRRDAEVLSLLGIGRVYEVSRSGVSGLCQELEGENEVVMLTDFDEEGEMLNKRMSAVLTASGLEVNEELRRRFGEIVLPFSRTLEGLRELLLAVSYFYSIIEIDDRIFFLKFTCFFNPFRFRSI